MARFAIHEKSGVWRTVPLGRCKTAFFITGWWLVAKGLWLEALAVFAFVMFVVFPLFAQAPFAALVLAFVPGIWLWLEGRNMVAARLVRRGWNLVALVEAGSANGAELALVSSQAARPPATPPPLPAVKMPSRQPSRPRVQGNLKGPAPFGMEGL